MSKQVRGVGNIPNKILLLLEAPATWELRLGKPLVGESGREMDWQYYDLAGITRDGIRIENVYEYLLPIKDNDKKKHVAETWEEQRVDVLKRIKRCNPTTIIACGAIANKLFFDDVNMSRIHGIPHKVEDDSLNFPVVIPCFHPASGLHQTSNIAKIRYDFTQAGRWLRGEIDVWEEDKTPIDYSIDNHLSSDMVIIPPVISLDIEWAKDDVWSLQWSTCPGKGYLVWKHDVERIKHVLENTLVIVHSAVYDIDKLNMLGIYPKQIIDTMWMAKMLDEVQGLKTLAYRYCNMKMDAYQDVIREATQTKVISYLCRAVTREWNTPEMVKEWRTEPQMEWVMKEEMIPCTKRKRGAIEDTQDCCNTGYYYIKELRDRQVVVLGTEDGYWHYRQPQNIKVKMMKLLKKYQNDSTTLLYDKWRDMEGTWQVESVMGKMEAGELCDIVLEKAVRYACCDADAAYRLFFALGKEMLSRGLGHYLPENIIRILGNQV